MSIRLVLILAMVAAFPPARPASARVVAGIEMPDTVRVGEQLLRLNGAAVYSKFGIRILAAGMWLERTESDPSKILNADLPRRYVTHFFHRVSAKRIRAEWLRGVEENSPGAGPLVKDQFRTLSGWIHDFRTGEEIEVAYLPGRGSEVVVDGVFKGRLLGKGFADAYFACAIGPRSRLGRGFKRRLLGG